MIRTGYLNCLFEQAEFLKCVNRAKKKLKDVNFEAFAVTGNSGTIMGGALALAMKKKLILVRKQAISTHSVHMVEGDYNIGSYVFLDDFICTGETRIRVKSQIKTFMPDCAFVGTYEYRDNQWRAAPKPITMPVVNKKTKPKRKKA